MSLLYGPDGLDLDFSKTQASLGIRTKTTKKPREGISISGLNQLWYDELSRIDFTQYTTRFIWMNLPLGISSSYIESVLYQFGKAMWFYIEEIDKFYVLPCSYIGSDKVSKPTFDAMGRPAVAKPSPFYGTYGLNEQKRNKKLEAYLAENTREILHDMPDFKSADDIYNATVSKCVVICDSNGYDNANPIPRVRSAVPHIETLVTILAQREAAAVNASGFNLFKATGQEAALLDSQIEEINKARRYGALSAVVSDDWGQMENIQNTTPEAANSLFNAFQAADNHRLNSMGRSNNGIQGDAQYRNKMDIASGMTDTTAIILDGMQQRVRACTLINLLFGTDIFVEVQMDQMQAQQGTQGGMDASKSDNVQV